MFILSVPASGATYHVDGIDRTTTTGLTGDWGTLNIGASGLFPAEPASAKVGAVFAYNRAITTQVRRKVERWARRYGIPA